MYLWFKHTYLRNVLIDNLKHEICVNRVQYIIIIIIIIIIISKNKGDTSNNRGDWDYFKDI